MVRTQAFEQGMELRSVVQDPEVAEFVQDHIVPEILREPHYMKVEVDVPFP